jgi:hypothetical protein
MSNSEKTYLAEQEEEEEEYLEEDLKQDQDQEIFLKKFNKEFEKKQRLTKLKLSTTKKKKKKNDQKKKEKNIHELTIGEILINTKNTYIDIITEILSGDFDKGVSTIFIKNDRIFYIGVSLLIISFLIYILSFLLSSDNKENQFENDKINIYLTNSPDLNSPNKQDMNNNKQDINNNNNKQDINNSKQDINNNNNKQDMKNINKKNSESDEIILNTSDSFNISNKIDTSNLKEIQL